MAIYAVHSAGDVADARFVRQDFSRAGFVFGPFWLAAHRLWRPLALWLLGAGLVAGGLEAGLLHPGVVAALLALGDLAIGFEGGALASAALARRGAPLVDVAVGADRQGAERSYFARTLGAAPASASVPAPPTAARFPAAGIIGMFPEAGA